ncbi:helix-turn-helix domain-containing protein [Alloalcanivorax xenomutans]
MIEVDLHEIGARIRDVRGNLTQAAFAQKLGIERKTVGRYESGDRAPDAVALLRLMAEFGADPAWVLTGRGAGLELSDDERELLSLYRSAPLAGKMAAVGALKGAASSQEGVTISGNHARVAGRDYFEGNKKK